MLSTQISKPNDSARRIAIYMRYCSFCLLLLGLLRLLSFSVWSSVLDVLSGSFGLALYRTGFSDRDRVVALESVLWFALVMVTVWVMGIFTLVGLATGRSFVSGISLQNWQLICGYVVSGAGLAVYSVMLLVLFVLYGRLMETTLIARDEAASLRGSDRDGGNNNGVNDAPISFVPFGRLATTMTQTRTDLENPVVAAPRFPGKAYKLEM